MVFVLVKNDILDVRIVIPNWPATIVAFLVATTFFAAIGLPLARSVAPRGMPPLAMAPALGWAVFVAAALPALTLIGFGAMAVLTGALMALVLATLLWHRSAAENHTRMPRWCLGLAAILAVLPAMAIMPKHVADGILLAPPMFDHVKIAIDDAILRSGLPVANPFYGPADPGHLAYYYLWHFSTAMLASALHLGGWSAEAAMTGFTAFASLVLMMGVVVALGGQALGLAAAALLALPGSMRPILAAIVGADDANRVIPRSSDIGGWLNQAAWVPQHLASACCVILAGLLLLRLAEAGGVMVAAVLGLTVAAGFESSIWIGGVAFAVAGTAIGITLLLQMPPDARLMFCLRAAAAAMLALILILPFIVAELHAVQARGAGAGMTVQPYAVFGSFMPAKWRMGADLPAFWLLLLPLMLPAVMPLGLAALSAWPSRDRAEHSGILKVAGQLTIGCLATAWLLRSTIDNNDLGWRAVLPAVLLLSALAGCGMERLVHAKRRSLAACALLVAALGVPDAIRMIREYGGGQHPGDAATFAQSAALWQAVRRHSAPGDRVAVNPDFVGAATPWPVGISWATLSDRPSCYAGWETVIAYGSLPRERLVGLSERFARVFDGHAASGDVERLADDDNCAVAVVSRGDGAWRHDPFSNVTDFSLAEVNASWRIYVRAGRKATGAAPGPR